MFQFDPASLEARSSPGDLRGPARVLRIERKPHHRQPGERLGRGLGRGRNQQHRPRSAWVNDSGRELLLCGARRQSAHLMERADFHRHVGDENICRNIGDAIARAEALHNEGNRRGPIQEGECLEAGA